MDQPRTEFTATVMQTFGVEGPRVRQVVQGRFDDDTLEGDGSRSIDSSDPSLGLPPGTDPFLFRVEDGVFWFSNPLSEPPAWSGAALDEWLAMTGSAPSRSVDVDATLDLIAGSAIEVIELDQLPSGVVRWTITVRACDLVPAVSGGGAAQRILDLGGDIDTVVQMGIRLDGDGLVERITVDFDEWWTALLERFEPGVDLGRATMSASWSISFFDESLDVQPPCSDPSTAVEDGIEFQTCPVAGDSN